MNPISHLRLKTAVASCLVLLLAGGCVWSTEGRAGKDLGVDPMASPLANSAAYRGTVGEYTYYDGLAPVRVRGYGLVVGLGYNGSTDCPGVFRSKLIQGLYKYHSFSSPVVGTVTITPEQIVDDIDTAVVSVEGEIPTGGIAGTRFDVIVRVLPGTSTKSLRGGRLYTTDLRVYRMIGGRTALTGQVWARARGPVFLNPFSDDQAVTQSNPLIGIVVGGGLATKSGTVRLVLTEPSYARAKQIQDRINSQFPRRKKVADAISPSYIRVTIPPEYGDETGHFLGLLRALYLSRDPGFTAVRALMLAREILESDAPHAMIALCFEALGRDGLAELNKLYANSRSQVSFHAALAGLRLEDHIAVDAMAIHAEDEKSEYRFPAIKALGSARGMANAAIALRRLLDDEDPRVKIAAYEALTKRDDTSIASKTIAGDNFILDLVPSTGRGFIYAKRQGKRRIALFGNRLRCSPPVFYRAPDGSVTISAEDGAEELTLMRVSPRGTASPRIPGPMELTKLIQLLGNDAEVSDDKVIGLGLDYEAIVRALYHLCEQGCVAGSFILEQPNVLEIFGPARPAGRPESEL